MVVAVHRTSLYIFHAVCCTHEAVSCFQSLLLKFFPHSKWNKEFGLDNFFHLDMFTHHSLLTTHYCLIATGFVKKKSGLMFIIK